ncbi:dynein axonemal intermediate chain 4-like [Embiotoca jacksoni]|uniref:dynein axonemal intermediate chain 4-like n=1 Tax=Embiotoca jacksoni TaxID=100190 RepID=UPI00370389A6
MELPDFSLSETGDPEQKKRKRRPDGSPEASDVPKKTHDVKQRVTDRTLDEAGCILLETDAILLLDMPCTLIAEDAEDAEATRERNLHYVDLCKNRMGNEKYVERSMQTFNGVPKTKQIQSDKLIMVDKDTLASVRDMYESFCQQDETTERKKAEQAQLSMSAGKQKRKEKSMSSFTGSTVSSLDMEMLGISLSAEPDFQEILLLESFKNSLLVTERSLVANMFQPKLAAYRELPVLEDPDSTAKPDFEEQSEEDKESSLTPHLECLWVFSCELTKGYSVTCMTWNKENPDYLAVGYRDCDSGLICYWSLNNVTLPQRVFHCHDIVTSLDFSANKPDQLAVGMRDGTIAIYNVQFQGSAALLANNSNCTKKHVRPVWQITWTKQELRSVWEDRDEVLISVSADGRVTKWFFASFSNSLDCLDLMKLKRVKEQKKKTEWNKKKNVMSKVTPVLCVDFHPTDSGIYLVGTWEGSIHKCHYSNNQRVLETYQKHFCPVNHVEWSPFSPDVFLSCSSDWTVQLWKQDSSNPVLSFTSIKSDVYTATWSPKWPTVFGVINRQQVEIWDLNSSIVLPTIVHHTMPFVKLTCLLFAKGTDCILVGDTGGQVSVYKLNNLNVGEGNKVDSLDDIIQSAVARCI